MLEGAEPSARWAAARKRQGISVVWVKHWHVITKLAYLRPITLIDGILDSSFYTVTGHYQEYKRWGSVSSTFRQCLTAD